MKKIVVFTDLDGTLLDSHTYSFAEALPSIQLLRVREIPLVISSSKTRVEIELYRRKLGNRHPFISENGGGIFIPKGYFTINTPDITVKTARDEHYDTIILGTPYQNLCRAMQDIRAQGFPVKGFSDMTVEEVAALTSLSTDEAAMAKARDFDEPFLFEGKEEEIRILISVIQSKGFTVTRGRFFHIIGNNDKGMAVAILSELYNEKFGEILTIGIGDSPNDLPMLKKVKIPVIVQKPDGSYDPQLDLPGIIKAAGIGPKGWNKAVTEIIA